MLSKGGEFGLIEKIQKQSGSPRGELITGIGDDTAVFRPHPGKVELFTADSLVEHVHFDRSYIPLKTLGWKALAVNISDVAAMGGRPLYALVSLALDRTWNQKHVTEFYRGLNSCAAVYDVQIAGGDTTASDKGAFISVALIGEAEESSTITRGGAHAGDIICVSGTLGGARFGFETLKEHGKADKCPKSVEKFLTPKPRVELGQAAAKTLKATAMIDISDGLSSELHHICRESGLGCVIHSEAVPVHPELINVKDTGAGTEVEDYVLCGGEEYELVVVLPPDYDHLPAELRVIGKMRARGDKVMIEKDGKEIPLQAGGWNHFT